MQWLSPGFVSESEWYAILYYGLVLILFSSANTLVSVPYNAMVPDIATDYHDRTTVVLLQEVFGLSAVILFSFIQAFVVEAFVDPETDQVDYEKGYTVAALITFLPVVVPMIVSVIFLKEPPVELDPSEDTAGKNFFVRIGLWFWFFLKSLLKAMIFLEFMLVVLLFVACMLAVYLFVSNFVLYIKYVLHAEDQTQWLLLCTQVCPPFSSLPSLPPSLYLSLALSLSPSLLLPHSCSPSSTPLTHKDSLLIVLLASLSFSLCM